jgi:hypothetical protein
LNVGVATVARLIGMREHELEIAAVLSEFFELTDDGWIHSRADKEIEHYHSKIQQASRAGKASAERRINARSTDVQPTNNQEPITNNHKPNNIEPTVLVDQDKPERLPPCPTKELIDLYHKHLPMLPRVELISDQRKKSLSARWRQIVTDEDMPKDADAEKLREDALSWFDWYFNYVSKSDFLTGRSKDWRADFDFLITASKFTKVVEGHYHKG